jgi:hypothetical protein
MRAPCQMKRRTIAIAARTRGAGVVYALLLAIALTGLSRLALAQPQVARDYEVKAGFLIKFTQYTAWPSNTFASSNAPVVIGVLDGEPLFRQLEQEARGVASSRPVEVRQVSTVEEASHCHVVFITESEGRNESEWFAALKGRPVLTVGESDRTIERGGVMRFVIKNKSVRFEANLASAAENQLILDEGMLRVATKVYKRRESD